MKDRLAVYCWIVLAIGSAATILNELVIDLEYIHSPLKSESEEDQITLLIIFRLTMTPIQAGLIPFINFSIIHLSLIFSSYLKELRKEIEHWSSLGLKAKERLRLTYWKVQSLIQVNTIQAIKCILKLMNLTFGGFESGSR